MNILTIAWSYLRNKALNTTLNLILLALGVGMIVFLMLVQKQIEEKFTNDVKGIKMVVGAKGSPLQLILCNVYHIDNPTGNIPLEEANQIANNRRWVKKSIPLALGDSHEGFRIVGTNHDFPAHYSAKIAEGKLWSDTMEVTLGAEVARKLKMKVGDTFYGAHGLVKDKEAMKHDEDAFKVVGILAPTNSVEDRVILTSIESVWAVHGDKKKPQSDTTDSTEVIEKPKEITALLITQYTNPLAALQLPRMVNTQTSMQAASPAIEVTRMFDLLGVGEQVLRIFAYILIFIASLSVFIALLNALKERRYDLALMRALGGSRTVIFSQIILEGVLLAGLGTLIGMCLGHGAVEIISTWESVSDKVQITGWLFLSAEWGIMALMLGVGVLASLLPALQVYRLDIAKTLTAP
jgi:putative ABC transport system permease protein